VLQRLRAGKAEGESEELAHISHRGELIQENVVKKNVFINCCGFIRIRDGVQPLDATRIHNENFSLAKKISQDALEDDPDVDLTKDDSLFKTIMKKPQKLQDLDLEDYSKHLA